jgi:hypothetical protein
MLGFFTDHFVHFFFFGPGEPVWYERAVWGNVAAVLPLAVLALIGWFWHKGAVEEMHRKLDAASKKADVHAEHMKKVLDLLDPETDGGIADVHAAIAEVKDALDPDSPGGLQVIAEKIDALGKPTPVTKSKPRKSRSGSAVE